MAITVIYCGNRQIHTDRLSVAITTNTATLTDWLTVGSTAVGSACLPPPAWPSHHKEGFMRKQTIFSLKGLGWGREGVFLLQTFKRDNGKPTFYLFLYWRTGTCLRQWGCYLEGCFILGRDDVQSVCRRFVVTYFDRPQDPSNSNHKLQPNVPNDSISS
jgi:hypothetical protein